MEYHPISKACRESWIKSGRGKLLLGLSGGADSTALLMALKLVDIPFEAVHCNFNLRGDESRRDREFVIELCTARDIPLHIVDFDTHSLALKGESTEMTCRRLRYDYFRTILKTKGFSRIAIAHNADDNVETFFLNALRGASCNGLKGMAEDNGEIIRPLLRFRRKEIIDFLNSLSQLFVTDSSNLESEHYRRNFLRNEIFPLLESRWQGFSTSVTKTMAMQSRDSKIVNHFVGIALEGVQTMLPWERLSRFPDPETLIFYFIKAHGGTTSIAEEMERSMEDFIPGKQWIFPNGVKAVFTREGILILDSEQSPLPLQDKNLVWEKIENVKSEWPQISRAPIETAYLPYPPEKYLWVNADSKMKIKSLGLKGSQTVWKILKDAGVSLPERGMIPVLTDAESGEPVWIPGYKRSRIHLVSPEAPFAYKVHSLNN